MLFEYIQKALEKTEYKKLAPGLLKFLVLKGFGLTVERLRNVEGNL